MNKPEIIRTDLSTPHGEFEFIGYFWAPCDDQNILTLVKRPLHDPVLVRIQSACYSGEIFESNDCDCHEQLARSLERISAEGGVFIYMLRDGRGAGLQVKLKALAKWRESAIDTADAYQEMGVDEDPRRYEKAGYVLKDLGVTAVRLLTNNPRKLSGLKEQDIAVSREPIEVSVSPDSDAFEYLRTKATKLGHMLRQFDK